MAISMDHVLQWIQSFGSVGYWLIGFAAFLEAFFLTGVIVPGTLVVNAGGILVQRGLLDFATLASFIAVGSFLGGELGYALGRSAQARSLLGTRFGRSGAFLRAQTLFVRHGALALVVGRYLGPVSGLVPLAAALSGMGRRQMLVWNAVGSVLNALAHLALGYAIGGALGLLGGGLTRGALVFLVVLALFALLSWLLWRAIRLLPLVFSLAEAVGAMIAAQPVVARWLALHPGVAGWLSARVDRGRFTGLPLTCIGLVFAYILSVWVDTALDFVFSASVQGMDERLASLIHVLWSGRLIQVSARVTALGYSAVVTLFMGAALVWLWAERRAILQLALGVAVAGNLLSVWLLKQIFARPRPDLAWFLETSGSFPSGHAAISVAFYGTVAWALWRAGRLGPVAALMAGGIIAFAIGISRLLLIEHYLSDVLSGWLVGLLWLLVAMAVAGWLEERHPPGPVGVQGPRRGLTAAPLVVAFCGLALWQTAVQDKPLAIHPAPPGDRIVATGADAVAATGAQSRVESLLGKERGTVDMVFAAHDLAELGAAVQAAGWTPVPGGLSGWMGAALSGTFVEPLFVAGAPQAMAVRSPAGTTPSILRLWHSDLKTSDGRELFLGQIRAADDDAAAVTVATAGAQPSLQSFGPMLIWSRGGVPGQP